MNFDKHELTKVAEHGYFVNSDMIKFLLAENIAIKTLLCEKGIVSPDELAEAKQNAVNLLEQKTKTEVTRRLAEMLGGPPTPSGAG